MKKTLTVNLNNIVFHIDDDAFEMLQSYLHEIAEHFQLEEEKKDIMNDIEARIAELFNEKLQKNKNVVNLTDVQEVIEIMGNPSQYTDDDQPNSTSTDKKTKKQRRYYRDPENAKLGGIGSGLAAYFNLDVTLVRIILVILAIASLGNFILVYVIVWFIAPQATSASQRLEMQGEDVTIESIKTELINARNYVESDKFKQTASHAGIQFAEVIQWFVKIALAVVGAIIGFVGVVLIGALLVFLFFVIFEPALINSFALDNFSNWAVMTPYSMAMIAISLVLVVGCPIFMLIYWVIRLFSGRISHNHTASWVVFILWLAGLFMFFSIGVNSFSQLHSRNGHLLPINWLDDDFPMENEERQCDAFNVIDISGNIELILSNDSVQHLKISSPEGNLSKVITTVENAVLRIRVKDFFLNETIKIYVSSDSISQISAQGVCQINTESEFRTSNLKLDLAGACQVDMDVNLVDFCELNLTGASQANLRGSCKNLKVDGSGVCQIDASNLLAKTANIRVTGASQANVYASELLVADASGASQIDCIGSPKNSSKNTHLGSEINVE